LDREREREKRERERRENKMECMRGPALPSLDGRQHSRFGELSKWPPSACN
jgi:hypothetical protein